MERTFRQELSGTSLDKREGVHLSFCTQQQAYRLAGGKNQELIHRGNEFLMSLEVRNLSFMTVCAYGYDLVIFFHWLNQNQWGITHFDQIDFYKLIMLVREREMSPRSINRLIGTCIRFYFHCFDLKPKWKGICWPEDAPVYTGQSVQAISYFSRASRLKIKVPDQLIDPLTPDQIRVFFEGINRYRDLAIVGLMLFNGLRSCEILNLKLSQINSLDRSFQVMGKGRKQRTLPLAEEVYQSLERYCRFERPKESTNDHLFLVSQGSRRGLPMVSAGLRNLFRYRRQVSGVYSANAHRFRHTFGTDLARNGVKLPVLQKLMGHSHLATTLGYIHLSSQDIQEEYQNAIQTILARYQSSSV